MPKLAKASDGKLEGLTFPGLAASCPGMGICPVKSGLVPQDGENMKKSKKVMALVLALSMVVMSGTLAFADVETDTGVGTTDTNTATDTSVDEGTKADAGISVDEKENAADVSDESTGGEDGEEKEEVCDHDLVWKETVLPTCTKAGKFVRECTKCKDLVEEELTPYGHQLKLVDVEKPTATTEGKSISQCTVCGERVEETIPVMTEETEVTVTVKIHIYDAQKDEYGAYGKGEHKKTITLSQIAKSYEKYSLNITEKLHEQTDLDGQLGEGVTAKQLRAVDGRLGNFEIVYDANDFQNQFVEGIVGIDGVTIEINARPWHNYTEICYYFERPDGKWSMKNDSENPYGYLGRTYKDTLMNTQVEYRPELSDEDMAGYEYADYKIGYFHNDNSLVPKEMPIEKNELTNWGLNDQGQGVITGQNINFYADDQLYIFYMYALKAYNVNYNLAGGNVNGATEIATQTAKRTTTVSVISDPVRSGYTFKGWTVTADNGQTAPAIADGKFVMPAANVTLTANWKAAPYIPPVGPTPGPVDPQPLPPDEPLEDPDDPAIDPQPLPPDEPLIEGEDPKQPLPEDEHLIDPTDVEKTIDPKQPKTGDEAPLMALGGLFFAAAGALGAIYIRRRTEKK